MTTLLEPAAGRAFARPALSLSHERGGAAALILASGGQPVIAMGGFTNSDPAPTVTLLEAPVPSGELRFVLPGGGGPGRGGSSAIDQRVRANGSPVDAAAYGRSSGQQLCDFGAAASSAVALANQGNGEA
jgi:hypothetical protein